MTCSPTPRTCTWPATRFSVRDRAGLRARRSNGHRSEVSACRWTRPRPPLLDAGFLDLAEGAGLLLPNASEAHALTGDSDPEAAARSLAQRFGEVVVTLGPGGALWTDGDEVLRVAAVAVEHVEDSTGAGDAFGAGFCAARVAGESTAESLAAGCGLAARAVSTAGARP